MRRDINILWLEDAITSGAHKDRKELVKNILKSKGYEGNICQGQYKIVGL